jgi:hypothetical protein
MMLLMAYNVIGRYVASYYEPWIRTKDTKLKAYIGAYVDVQVRSLLMDQERVAS